MIKFPKQLVQDNESDHNGIVWSSNNLDLHTNKGRVKISPKSIITTDAITDLGRPVGFAVRPALVSGDRHIYTVAGSYVWGMNSDTGNATAFTKITAIGAPGTGGGVENASSSYSDIILAWSKYFVVSTGTRVRYKSSDSTLTDSWTAIDGGLPSGNHILTVLGDRLYVISNNGNAREIKYTTPAFGEWAVGIDLISTYGVSFISTLKAGTDVLWVGTVNRNGNFSYIFKWNGVAGAASSNVPYVLDGSSGVLAMVMKENTPWVMTVEGRLMYFNGGSFVEAPNGKLPVRKLLKNSFFNDNDRWIHPNGMVVIDGRINILISNEYEDGTYEERLPSGVWEYDIQGGWNHKSSLTSGTDYGQNIISTPGAIKEASGGLLGSGATENGNVFYGASVYSDATTTKNVILVDDTNDTLSKSGYLISQKIEASEIEDIWQRVFLATKGQGGKIVVKYRLTEEDPETFTITWTGENSFTSTGDMSNIEVGDEVEVLNGTGGGWCPHLATIQKIGSTYHCSLDESFTGLSGTAKVRCQKWIKTQSIESGRIREYTIDKRSNWLQIKIYCVWSGENQIDSIIITNKKHR